jgi:hypothetical protein
VVGGTLWTDHARLKQAKYPEAFLNRGDQHYQVAL